MLKFTAYDDVRYSQGKEELADRQITLTYGSTSVELDLTELTEKEALDLSLGALLEMGRPLVPSRKEGKGRIPGQGNRYFAGMREYAKARGITVAKQKNGYLYPKSLRDSYATYLATQVRGSVP